MTLNNSMEVIMEMLKNYPDVLTIYQVCEVLHLGRQSVYQLLQNEAIKHVRVGRKYIIPRNSVIDFLHSASITTTSVN